MKKQKKQGVPSKAPPKKPEARPKAGAAAYAASAAGSGPRKKRRLKPARVAVFVLILLLLAAGIVAAVVLLLRPGRPASGSGEHSAVFGLKSIAVEGSTHYTDEEIIEASGLSVGQSIFSLKKKQAAENILRAFPYVERVMVESPSFTSIKISIVEAEPVAAVQAPGGWIILGENGKGLEKLPEDSSRLADYLLLRCTLADGAGVGSTLLSDQDMQTLQSLLNAISSQEVTDIREIDLRDAIDIRLLWKDQITVLLGSDINLEHKLAMFASTLKLILQENGEDAQGQIDLSSYSNSDPDKQQAVYTPQEVLTAGSTTGTAADPTQASDGGTTEPAA